MRISFRPLTLLAAFVVAVLLALEPVPAAAQGTGILREVYTNIPGSALSDLTNAVAFPNARGIHSTITATVKAGVTQEQVVGAWTAAYGKRPFVRIRKTPKDVEVANTTGTNFIDIAAALDGRTLIIASVEDNLVKGASGQAIQNLNLMFGLDESMGLLRRGI